MSSFNNNSLFFKLRFNVALFSAIATSGCFQPMLGGYSGVALTEELKAIAVQPIDDRIGHHLGNELSFALNGSGSVGPEKYKLIVTLSQRVQTPIIDTVSGRASAASLLIDAEYRLLETGSGRSVSTGTAIATTSYTRTAQRFANLRAARDAELKSARILADQIKIRLASDLAKRL